MNPYGKAPAKDFHQGINNQNHQIENPYQSINSKAGKSNNNGENYVDPFANKTPDQSLMSSGGNIFEENDGKNPFEIQQRNLPTFENLENSVSNPYISQNTIEKNNQFYNIKYKDKANNNNKYGRQRTYDSINYQNQNQNNMLNPFKPIDNNNNSNKQKEQMPTNNQNEEEKIKEIIFKCQNNYKEGTELFENYRIGEAISKLAKAINILDRLKENIKTKKVKFTNYLIEIESLRKKIYLAAQQYRMMIYQLIPLKFRAVPYNQNDNLLEFSKRYILTTPFITFDDIYDGTSEENKIKTALINIYNKSQRANKKNLLICGPRGSGKTLAVHALANNLGAKIAQIEGLELFRIPYFIIHFTKAAFEVEQTKPLIIFVRNFETICQDSKAFNEFRFLFDKVCSSKGNVIIVVSTCVPFKNLPKNIYEMFSYTYCIRPALNEQKSELFKFITEKLNIKINMNNETLKTFVNQSFRDYSNSDLFNVVKTALDIRKENHSKENQDNIYNDELEIDDLMKSLNIVPGSLTPQILKFYYF